MSNWRQQNTLLRPFLSYKLDLFPCSTPASAAAYSTLPDLLAQLCWKLTQQNQNKAAQILGDVFGSYCSRKHTSFTPASNWSNRLLLLPWDEGLSSLPAGALALIRLSYLFSPPSAPGERWNPPQLMNNLGLGEGGGSAGNPTQVPVQGKLGR